MTSIGPSPGAKKVSSPSSTASPCSSSAESSNSQKVSKTFSRIKRPAPDLPMKSPQTHHDDVAKKVASAINDILPKPSRRKRTKKKKPLGQPSKYFPEKRETFIENGDITLESAAMPDEPYELAGQNDDLEILTETMDVVIEPGTNPLQALLKLYKVEEVIDPVIAEASFKHRRRQLGLKIKVIEIKRNEYVLVHPRLVFYAQNYKPCFTGDCSLHIHHYKKDQLVIVLLDGNTTIAQQTLPIKEISNGLQTFNLGDNIVTLSFQTEMFKEGDNRPEFSKLTETTETIDLKSADFPLANLHQILQITIKEANYSPFGKTIKMTRPRCCLFLRNYDQFASTKYVSKTCRPVWNEKFEFLSHSPENDIIEVLLFDGNSAFGQFSYPVNHLRPDVEIDKWFKISPLHGRPPGGKIHVSISMIEQPNIFSSVIIPKKTDKPLDFRDPSLSESHFPFGHESISVLKVQIVEVANLTFPIDASCAVTFRGYEPIGRTREVKNSLHPRWSEKYWIYVEDPVLSLLDVHLFDGKKRLGHCSVPIHQIIKKPVDGWLTLSSKDEEDQIEMHLRIGFEETAISNLSNSVLELKEGGHNPKPSAQHKSVVFKKTVVIEEEPDISRDLSSMATDNQAGSLSGVSGAPSEALIPTIVAIPSTGPEEEIYEPSLPAQQMSTSFDLTMTNEIMTTMETGKIDQLLESDLGITIPDGDGNTNDIFDAFLNSDHEKLDKLVKKSEPKLLESDGSEKKHSRLESEGDLDQVNSKDTVDTLGTTIVSDSQDDDSPIPSTCVTTGDFNYQQYVYESGSSTAN